MWDADSEALTSIRIIQADTRAAARQQGDSSWLLAWFCTPGTISGEPILSEAVWHGPLCCFFLRDANEHECKLAS